MKTSEQIAENCGKTAVKRPSAAGALLRHEAVRLCVRSGERGLCSRLLSVFVAAVLAATAGYVAFRFAEIYTGLREGGRIVVEQRLAELLSAGFFLSLLFSLPTAAGDTARALYDDGEKDILAVLPVKPSALAAAKVVCGLPRQFVCYTVCALVFSAACGIAAGKSAGEIVLCVLCAITVFPAVPLAGVLAAPLLRRLTELKMRHAVLSAVLTLAVVGAVFSVYAAGVGKIAAVLSESNPHTVFNAERTAALSRVLSSLYPAVFAARAAVGDGASAGIAAAIGAGCALLCGLFTVRVLPATMKNRGERNLRHLRAECAPKTTATSRRAACGDTRRDTPHPSQKARDACAPKGRSAVFSVMVQREIRAVLGTGRGFALFSPLVLAPLAAGALSYIALGAASKMLTLDISFPVALTVGAVSAVFFGGAAASAVTADKHFLRIAGTLPVYPSCIATAKVALYGGVALVTGIMSGASAALIAGLRGLSALEVVVAVGLCALSASLFAFVFDLLQPDMRLGYSGENGVATLLGSITGLGIALVQGGLSAALSVLSFSVDGALFGWLSRVVPVIGALIVSLIAASVCLFRGDEGVRRACRRALAPPDKMRGKRRVRQKNARIVFSEAGGEADEV